MATYLGGLALLVLLLPTVLAERSSADQDRLWASVLHRFSPLALACVALLLLTGLYQSWAQLATPAALTATPYGLALLVKLAFVAPLLLLGARHFQAVRIRPIPTIRLALRAALGLGLLVLLVTAILANLAPVRTTLLDLSSRASVVSDPSLSPPRF
jgi:copper transport protein